MSNSSLILDAFRISSEKNPLLDFHIQRTFEAIQFFQPQISFQKISKLYQPFRSHDLVQGQKCRLMIDPFSNEIVESVITSIPPLPQTIRLDLATHRTQVAGLGLQNFKTNDRKYWDDNLSLKWPGTDDVIGINSNGELTETSRFNLFFKNQDQVYTPHLSSGCINGCLRRYALKIGLIEINQVKYSLREKNFSADDLKDYEIYVGNSLRGITKASLAII